jgi:hypothetical protein
MKRDPELIRALLLKFEGRDDWLVRDYGDVKIDGYDPHQITGHIALMFDAGLVTPHNQLKRKGSNRVASKGRRIGAVRLTNAAYDFLDTVRDEKIWR